ncbi:zf-DHHC-domain-containing protein [Mycena belliarum]|uniref:Palmitoyltransferase PFA4 n=1 Tax=Mycena belliarum TaxID=1033014 RepID=A0AAD6XXL1_9AGAR|nr:zf-DHHC-domain-containing protein [Mycena belliae]
MAGGFIGRLIVNFVVLLICFIAYSVQIFVVWPWYGRALSVQLVTLLLPFNLLVGMLFWNYFLCVTSNPGEVPENWRPDTHIDGYEVKKLTGGPRYCRMCERPKPPRTHHCRQCGRCVLRMDHHCPWINNCVGHFTHGYFIRFLFYVDVACSYHLAMVTRRVLSSMGGRYWDEPDSVELVFIILNFVACVPVLMSVGAFSLYHFSALMNNTTTIEGWEKDKVATMVRRGKIREIKFPYNIGRRQNIESILGANPWLWCWPAPTPGTGLKYKLTDSDDTNAPVSENWPPRDPSSMHEGDPDKEFVLPNSPWTYENGSVNPDLQPSNSAAPRRRRRDHDGASALPPYHPDYQASVVTNGDYSSDEDEEYGYKDDNKTWVRRGSEGYEVRPAAREDMLERYLLEIGETPQRYHRYIPQPDSESEGDDVPLGQQLKH